MSGNLVSGRVVAKETGLGIPDLLVVLYDLDPGTQSEDQPPTAAQPEGVARSANPGSISPGDRLGSRLTDANGAFSFVFADDEFRIRNAKEKRPDIVLLILAPDEPGLSPADRVLFTTRDLRTDAGRTEQYLIRLPAEILAKAGLSVPLEPGVAQEDPAKTVGRLAQAEAWRADFTAEARKLAQARIAKAREEAKQIDDGARQSLLAALTKASAVVTAHTGNVVLGDESVEAAVWAGANRRIEKVNAAAPVKGYLVLTPDQAQTFREGAGWRGNLTEAEIAPYLYRAGDGGRPASYILDDPAEAMRRAAAGEAAARVLDPPAAPITPVTTSEPAGGGNSPAAIEMSTADLPTFLGRVMQDLVGAPVASEDGADATRRGRPTAADVQASVAGLSLKSGPADVTAFHDYSTLQIAFDHIWRELLDPAVVETGQAVARQLHDAGADPLGAMAAAAEDPVKALRREAGYVARTRNPFDDSVLPDWVGDLNIGPRIPRPDVPGGGGGGGTPQPEPDPTPTPTGPGSGPGADTTGPRPTTNAQAEPSIHELLDELEGLLNDTYKFDVFAAGSVNFGLMVTYRQKWTPITYQAGDLVETLTLTPKETRTVATKRTVKRERSVKENESNLRNRTDESKSTLRADAEVVDRAATKTNFSLAAKGSYSVGLASAEGSTSMDRGADASSQETKKSFHENVINAAMQLRSEKSWTFETKDMFEDGATSMAEITNPNDELTVSYLFYELERRYRVSEHLHKLTPVVLVAMEVPAPGRQPIDKLLLTHSWIINRVLLDDRYRAPLEYLCNRIVGDELGLAQMARGVAEIRAVVTQLQTAFRRSQAELLVRETSLTDAITRRAKRIGGENTEGVIESAMEWLAGSGSHEDVEAARVIEDMRRESYERAAKEQKELSMRLDAETASLSAANAAYAKAYAEHMNRRMEVGGLRAHFKENVLYYMQAIWSFTFADQIYFQVYDVKAPVITAQTASYGLREVADPPLSIPILPGRIVLEVSAEVTLAAADITVADGATTLAQIADLDRPLGFKGNYMIFPLKESNPLTDLMMTPYLNTEFGLHDPDELGAWAPEDFLDYAIALLATKTADGSMTAEELVALRAELQARYKRILTSPRLLNDEIVVPTDSLFIEALPGAHPLLEDFKLDHRRLDVEKVREETRRMQLESLRYAARLLGNELEDPDIERQIVVKGAGGLVLPTDQ